MYGNVLQQYNPYYNYGPYYVHQPEMILPTNYGLPIWNNNNVYPQQNNGIVAEKFNPRNNIQSNPGQYVNYNLLAWNGQNYPALWNPYSNYTSWNHLNYGNGVFWIWPTMQPVQFSPWYQWPTTDYTNALQTSYPMMTEQTWTEQQQRPKHVRVQETVALQDTPSEVIGGFHLPTAITKRTRSDLPYNYDVPINEKSDSEMAVDLPDRSDENALSFLLKISDCGLRQIASSRSLGGPSVIMHGIESSKDIEI